MSDDNLYISNGECFYGEGEISDPRFIPCGNAAAAGTQACCFQGDFCLSANVCYDNDTSVTYIAGCTDATYSSSKCPHKAGYPDQQWVALARCDGDDIDLFSGCGHHKDEVVIKHEDCTCDAASALISNPATGQPTLNQIGLLPTTAGGTISFNPTALPTATAASDSHSGGLTTGAKAGIGVGVGIGVPVIAAAIFLFYFLRRKKKRAEQQREQEQQQGLPPQGQHQQQEYQQFQPPPSELPPGVTAAHSPMMMMQQQNSPPPPVYSPDTQNGWLRGYKPELPGEPAAHKHELPGDVAHAQGDSINTNNYNNNNDDYDNNNNSAGVDRMDSIQRTPHESYPPSDYEIHRGSGSETPSLPFVSPQSTGDTDGPQAAASGLHQRNGSANMDPISEHRFDDRQY